MKGLLIFDHLNDVLFTKCNKKFTNHMESLAKLQGLISEEDENSIQLSGNILMQLFSPIVTSQQIKIKQAQSSAGLFPSGRLERAPRRRAKSFNRIS
ncbi:Protein of unknown function [Cotesia congregata]|uniref:Uncharacterized protein n=1 Tax=Cotesia congregata TaxID=51543 RepID=A0A8J2H461_COTCN|nr:Protein of unknown function [Cotesia congregata]